jgi:hypothetical protein
MGKLFKKFVLISFLLLLVGCGKKEVVEVAEPEVEESVEVVAVEEVPDILDEVEEEIDLTGLAINPLTGLYIDEALVQKRPVGIMINNHNKAMPQSGIAAADVMYEALVEGGICRLFAVYQDFQGEKVGPIRSSRHYFLDFAFDFDAIYVHIGGSVQAYNAIKALSAPNLDAMSSAVAYKDPNRVSPHSTYTTKDMVSAVWERKGYRVDKEEGFVNKFEFGDDVVLEGSALANKVVLDYSAYQYSWFEYDEAAMNYKRFQFLNNNSSKGTGEHIDVETGEQLTYENIIVQMVEVFPIKGDKEGRVDMNLISKGTGFYVTKGVYVPIAWSKASHNDPTKYFTLDGKSLVLTRGKTWISIFPTYREDKVTFE